MIGRPVPKRGSVRSVFARSGLRNTLGGAKLTEIAKLFGVTPQAVSLWDLRALGLVQRRMKLLRESGDIRLDSPDDARDFATAFDAALSNLSREDAIVDAIVARARELRAADPSLDDEAAVKLATAQLTIVID